MMIDSIDQKNVNVIVGVIFYKKTCQPTNRNKSMLKS